MSHLNFSLHAAQSRARRKTFNARAHVPFETPSLLWTVFLVMAVAGVAFTIVWFA